MNLIEKTFFVFSVKGQKKETSINSESKNRFKKFEGRVEGEKEGKR